MVQQQAFRNPGPIPGGLKQPAEIRPGSPSDRVAWRHEDDHHRGRHVCGYFRQHPEPVYQLYHRRSRKDQAGLYPGRKPLPCPFKSRPAKLHPSYHQQYEGQHRPLPGGRDHRRVPGGQKRPWVSDHLLQPGLQDGLASDVHRAFMHHGNGAVCGD